MSKKRILIFIDWFTPGYRAGGPVQSIINLINNLGNEMDISIVTSNKDLGDSTPYTNIPYNIWITKERCRAMYLDVAHQNLNQYNILLSEQAYDFIYLNSLFSIYFTLLPLWAVRKEKIKIILAPRGMLGDGALNIKKKKKQLFLMLFRLSGFTKKIIWHATAMNEVMEIKKHFGKDVQVRLAPNFSASMLKKVHVKEKKINELQLFFLSRIAEKKNLKAALQYLAKIDPMYHIDFTIIGPVDEEDYWSDCQQIIYKMPSHIEVQYEGAIPNQALVKYLEGQHAILLPTYHENFGHVIMEAWQNACLAIISDQTPWSHLAEKHIGWDIPLDESEQFIKTIETIAAMDQEHFTSMSSAAVEYAWAFTHNPEILDASLKLFGNMRPNEN